MDATFSTRKHYYQRARRGYSDRDCWSLYAYLAEVVVGGIAVLRSDQDVTSHPANLTAHEEWDSILAEMQDGFKLLAEDMWWRVDNPNRDADTAKIERAEEVLVQYFEGLWD